MIAATLVSGAIVLAYCGLIALENRIRFGYWLERYWFNSYNIGAAFTCFWCLWFPIWIVPLFLQS